jgi:protein involved in polysaccharide export with SLBB domain
MSASFNRRRRLFDQSLPWLLLLAPLYAGCTEHRITLDEFLAIQEARKAAESISPQPAASQPAVEAIAKDLGPYRIGPGDTLSIRHFGAGEDTLASGMQLRVDRDGNIELPVAGKLKIAGMDLVEADRAVQAALVPGVFRDVVVHVQLVEPEATRVLVTGGTRSATRFSRW